MYSFDTEGVWLELTLDFDAYHNVGGFDATDVWEIGVRFTTPVAGALQDPLVVNIDTAVY